MPKPYRFLALGVLAAFGAGLAGHFARVAPSAGEAAAPPTLLPAAHANPAEVAFTDTLRRGETMGELLRRSHLAEAEATALLVELKDYQDPRRLRPGSVVSYRKSFLRGDVREMALRLDADRTLSVRRAGDAWQGEVEEIPVRADTAVLTGTVRSSLYAALVGGEDLGIPTEERERIVDLLADRIFAWQIDFSRDLQPGDEFRILYERLVRPDGSARSNRVLGVQVTVGGREHEAFYFRSPDGAEDYYDPKGESLRRAFLRAPLEFRRISSAFSKSRFHPILKRSRPHNGIDYAAASGTPVRAVGDGVIARAGRDGGYGNVVEIRHKRGYSSRYAHLKGFAKGIRPGVRVRQGDVIGYVGMTGLATGPHLHYEFHANGRPVNPNSIKYLSGDPVPGRYLSRFAGMVSEQIAAMNRADDSVRLVHVSSARSHASED